MKIIDCVQGEQAWFDARKGLLTASRMGGILTPKTMKPAAAQEELICELIGETMAIHQPVDKFVSRAAQNGIDFEPEARAWYEMDTGMTVTKVGLCVDDQGRFGASPDGLVDDEGLLELKVPQPKTHVQYLIDGSLPSEYRGQVHGQLIVTGRAWCDFCSYCPGLPPLVIRVTPDEFTAKLIAELETFWAKYTAVLNKIKAMG